MLLKTRSFICFIPWHVKQNPITYLKTAYFFFDFSRLVWENYWKNHQDKDPFQVPIFSKRPAGKYSWPKNWKEGLDLVQREKNMGICFLEESYPLSRENLYLPPVLYIQGKPIPKPESLVTIVGTRKPSSFGVSNAIGVSDYFSREGIGIVSGLARGIDTITHRQCLKHASYTIAVLGSGFDVIYPRENERLLNNILISGGTIISQFPPHIPPYPSNFPRRNQIIAELSSGTIVVEGSVKSGAAITGKYALAQSKTVVVFVQDYRTQYGKGTVALIQAGATPVTSFEEAHVSIAQPLGGRLTPLFSPKNKGEIVKSREYSLADLQKYWSLSLPQSVARIEKLCHEGRLLALPNTRYLILDSESL